MMFFWSRALVKHLEEEIAWLRLEKQKETQRANIAVAELVRLQTAGHANVQPQPLIADREADLSKELESLRNEPEWAQAGN